MGVGVPDLQVIGRDADLHLLRLPCRQGDALEAAQTFGGRVAFERRIQLHHFLAVTLAGVLQVEAEHVVVAVLRDLQAGVLERRVAQAVAEREDRLAAEVHVSAVVRHVVVKHVRKVEDVGHPRLVRTARGVVVAEKNVGKAIAQLLAALGQVHDAGDVRRGPVDREREAADHNSYRVVVSLPYHLDKVFRLQLQRAAVQGLAAVTGNGAVAPRGLNGLAAPVGARSRMVANAHDADVGPLRKLLRGAVGIPGLEAHLGAAGLRLGLDTVKRGHGVGRKGAVPVLQDLVGTVTEHGDLLHLALVDREDVAVVLKKHNGLLRHETRLVLVLLRLPRRHVTELHIGIGAVSVHKAELQHRPEVHLGAVIQRLL